jgi:hypothetical protein
MRWSPFALLLALLLVAADLTEVADVAEVARGGLACCWPGFSSGRVSDLPLVMGGRVGRAFTCGLEVGFGSSPSFFLVVSFLRVSFLVVSFFVASVFLGGSLFLVTGAGRFWALAEAAEVLDVRSSAALLNGMLSTEVSGVDARAEGGSETLAASSGGTVRSDRIGLLCGDCCGLSA